MVARCLAWIGVAGCIWLAGCQEEDGGGIAFLHIGELDGPCPAYSQNVIDRLEVLPFRRAHAIAAYQGGSAWDGGNLIAIAWQDADGTVGRLYYDIGPDRGYGITAPAPAFDAMGPREYQETTGLVQWNGDVRTFGALRSFGIVNYRTDAPPGAATDELHGHGEFFAQMAYEGGDDDGDVVCRVIGVHAHPTRDRVDPYDPSWLAPNPGVMMSVTVAPTFAGDTAPSTDLVAPALAGADPGGPAPRMYIRNPETDQGGSGDGTGGCD